MQKSHEHKQSKTSHIDRWRRFWREYTARNLERLCRGRGDIEIILVSNHNYFLMTPLLFEAGSGILEPRHAVSPLRAILRNVRFVHATVERVDLNARIVYAREEDETYELVYDQLVIAVAG